MKHQKLLAFALSLLWAVCLQAQELTVKSFEPSSDIVTTKDQRKDLNGGVCAVVKVRLMDKIDRVEGNVIGEVWDRGSEKWIYVTDGTREIRLFPQNHLPISIDCRKYGIDELRSRQVYILTLVSAGLNVDTPTSSEQSDEAQQKDNTQTDEALHAEEQRKAEEARQAAQRRDADRQNANYNYHPGGKHKSDKSWAIGVRAGLNMPWAQFDADHGSGQMNIGFHLGANFDVRASDLFWFSTGLFYSMKGYKYSDLESKASASYINLPLLASLRFGKPDGLQFVVNAGPYLGFGIGGTVKAMVPTTVSYDTSANLVYGDYQEVESKFFDYYKAFDYGLQLGVGLLISGHFNVGVNFEAGLAAYKNRNLSISLGYNF